MKIPSICESTRWFFTLNLSPTKENIPRIMTQIVGLSTTAYCIYKCMTSRYCSLDFVSTFISNFAAKIFGTREERMLKKFWQITGVIDTDVLEKVKSIDFWGCEKTMPDEIFTYLQGTPGKNLGNALSEYLKNDKNECEASKTLFLYGLKTKFNLAFADLSVVTYPEGTCVTIEFIESEEKMPKYIDRDSVLQKSYPNLDDLLAKFDEYCEIGYGLLQKGEIKQDGVNINKFGHGHPRLQSYLEIFSNGVKKHGKELANIYMYEKDNSKAAKAVSLLGYSDAVSELVFLLYNRVNDPNEEVRNATLQVLTAVAQRPEVNFKLDKILPILTYPSAMSRALAAEVIYHYLDTHKEKGLLGTYEISQAIPIFQKMRQSKQPNNRLIAEKVLKLLKKHYGINC
ncbi:MAG: hypothetical protein L0207_03405 [Chlamydiae bacterium]|nr:hypothetical protein [Chlamydiota bacterium]